ncbi:hypothetical protein CAUPRSCDRAFT_11448 [Caulochytrium protostelioides]|uniref:Uncharacterized protein n=1 Tax=Caulochytrium protostelioides TaxID=1555241 RepID=A0A4P9WWF3_9FUNG|nr:hypothetical protein CAUPRSCDRAFT_11448 [Caulochytrium protostelioides]
MLMFMVGHEGLLPFLLQALLCVAVTALPANEKRQPDQHAEFQPRKTLKTSTVDPPGFDSQSPLDYQPRVFRAEGTPDFLRNLQKVLNSNELLFPGFNPPAGAVPLFPEDDGSSPIGSAAGDEVGPWFTYGLQDDPIPPAGHAPELKQPQTIFPSNIPGSSNIPLEWDPELPQNQASPRRYPDQPGIADPGTTGPNQFSDSFGLEANFGTTNHLNRWSSNDPNSSLGSLSRTGDGPDLASDAVTRGLGPESEFSLPLNRALPSNPQGGSPNQFAGFIEPLVDPDPVPDLSLTPGVEATASEPTTTPGNLKKPRLMSLERSHPLKPLDLSQFPRLPEVVDKVAQVAEKPDTTFERFVYRLYKISLPSLDHRRKRLEVDNIPDLMVINAALIKYRETYGSAPSALAEGSEGHDNTDDLPSNQFVHFAVKYLAAQGIDFRPSFVVNNKSGVELPVMAGAFDGISSSGLGQPGMHPSLPETTHRESNSKSHKRQRIKPADRRGQDQFDKLVTLEENYRSYLETHVFPIEPYKHSQSIDLIQKIREYAEKQMDLELFDILNPDHDTGCFEQKSVVAACTSLRRRRAVLGLPRLRNLKTYLKYEGEYGHPTFAFTGMTELKDWLPDLQRNRDENVEQFELHRPLFQELISNPPYAGIKLPMNDIPLLSNALQNPVWYNLRQQFPDDPRYTRPPNNKGSSKPKVVKSGPSFRGAEFAIRVPL